MRKYELVVVLDSKLAEKDRGKMLETIKSWIKDFKIVKEDIWGQKPLSYPIKKALAGYYVMWQLEGETVPADLEKRLHLHDNVLRHLLLRTK